MVMSDRIALLRSGELEQVAAPRDIYSRPATAYVAQFIGHTNLLTGKVSGGLVRCGNLAWTASLPDGPVILSLRPEHVRIERSVGTGPVRVRGRVLQQAFHGATELIRVQCPDELVLAVRTASGNLQAGDDVELEFTPSDAVVVRESTERV